MACSLVLRYLFFRLEPVVECRSLIDCLLDVVRRSAADASQVEVSRSCSLACAVLAWDHFGENGGSSAAPAGRRWSLIALRCVHVGTVVKCGEM